ncbi:HNH endonuclease [Sporolactobacillus shoreicorticis]|uniref:Putative HNH nuclease YajD n=1 Tax=Sporolactobacillus shoreicorticis TaxID=1923877 RepID=A0ABW5S7B5_9BACL|nr:HNH endonuclease signature motif containing protein [Sporolactobacillus shoreicorticis]MCO7126627.1 HNH endonuclease [Sporolactobacillus shoreicorticis]
MIDIDEKYCDKHRDKAMKMIEEEKNKRNQDYNERVRWTEHDGKYAAFYQSSAWKKTRAYVIARANGLCEECLAKGYIKAGRVVDHVIPLKERWDLRLDVDNLKYLCQDCHNKKHKLNR